MQARHYPTHIAPLHPFRLPSTRLPAPSRRCNLQSTSRRISLEPKTAEGTTAKAGRRREKTPLTTTYNGCAGICGVPRSKPLASAGVKVERRWDPQSAPVPQFPAILSPHVRGIGSIMSEKCSLSHCKAFFFLTMAAKPSIIKKFSLQ